MEEIKGMFEIIEDTRHQSYVEHKLSDILILVMCAVICGITELADMMTYFNSRSKFFEEKYNIKAIPSKATISRILSMVDPNMVSKVIVEIMLNFPTEIGEILAVDGKAICGTGTKGNPHSFLQILSVYATESGISLAQSAIEHKDKTNEIPIFRKILDDLSIENKTITGDAMHCQKETCQKIISKKGDYVFGVKDNQETLYDDIKLFLTDKINVSSIKQFETIEKNGGRIEKRICCSTNEVDWITNIGEWTDLKSVFSVTRITTYQGKTTKETGFYISSLTSDPENLLKISRSHWKIESMHWWLDVVWNEDNNNLISDNSQKIMNLFRKLALFAHKQYVNSLKKKPSVKQNVLHALLDDEICFNVIHHLLSN